MVASVRTNVEMWRPMSVLVLMFIPDMCHVKALSSFSAERERERDRQTERDRQRQTEREKQTDRERKRDRKRQRE